MRLQVFGGSMAPALMDGQRIELVPLDDAPLRVGDVVACATGPRLVVHRIAALRADGQVITRGDARGMDDAPQPIEAILARARRPGGAPLPARSPVAKLSLWTLIGESWSGRQPRATERLGSDCFRDTRPRTQRPSELWPPRGCG